MFKIIFTSIIVLFFFTLQVSAQVNYRIPNPTIYNSVEDLINVGASFLRPVFVLTFGGMIGYGGWVRLTSQGNPDKIKKSTEIIGAAIAGFVIAVFAPTIVDFVSGFLGVDSVFSL